MDGGFNGEGAADTSDAFVFFWAINQGNGFGLLVISYGFESYTRNQTTNFFALTVLSALVNEAACGAASRVLQFVPGEGSRQQALTS
ncbi:hypothetical protein BFM99_17270 [Stutzerimonas stutzeri]|nr:hypothetical protein BFM99_17270 [Stutzerimonas stutzeri]